MFSKHLAPSSHLSWLQLAAVLDCADVESAGDADKREVSTTRCERMMYPGSVWTRLGKFNFWVFRREAAEFLLLFVTIFGYDAAFWAAVGFGGLR